MGVIAGSCGDSSSSEGSISNEYSSREIPELGLKGLSSSSDGSEETDPISDEVDPSSHDGVPFSAKVRSFDFWFKMKHS